MKICILSYYYPGKHNKSDYAFVKELVDAIASLGHTCYVVCPYNINHYRAIVPIKDHYKVGAGEVLIFRPYYFSLKGFNLFKWFVEWSYKKAIKKAFKMLPDIPDLVYGHFWHTAYYGYEFAKSNGLPIFVASGESQIRFRKNSQTKSFCDYVSGVICASTKNKDESASLGLASMDKMIVKPNAIDPRRFKLLDQKECRRKLNVPSDAFVVAFLGNFSERKGPLRVNDAIKRLNDNQIYSIYIGGNVYKKPDSNNVLFIGELPHDEIPQYLNAADIFVLPSLHEGCCNAIIEAMACGLPVISSNLPFNWDLLNETNSILVDPLNIDEIASAINLLKTDKTKRRILSEGAVETIKELTIEKRAKSILDYIVSKI